MIEGISAITLATHAPGTQWFVSGGRLRLTSRSLLSRRPRRSPRVAIGCYRSSRPIHFVAEGG